MRPRGMASAWVKHRPWYWEKERVPPSRAEETRTEVERDVNAGGFECPRCGSVVCVYATGPPPGLGVAMVVDPPLNDGCITEP